MIREDIRRVEELRYLISSKTYNMLSQRRSGEASNQFEGELTFMKDEMTNLLSKIQDSGYTYVLVNKKGINELKTRFMSLNSKERIIALNGRGEGGRILSEMMSFLRTNKENADSIATLILSLPATLDVVEGIKSTVEGNTDGVVVKLENSAAAGRIALALNSIRVSAKENGNAVFIGSTISSAPTENLEDLHYHEYETDLFGDVEEEKIQQLNPSNPIKTQVNINVPRPPVAFITPAQSNSPVSVIPPVSSVSEGAETILEHIGNEQQSKSTTMNENQDRRPAVVIDEMGITKAEPQPIREPLRSEDLAPKLTRDEVNLKIQQIMSNHKMKRWVLGAFKDETEREQYSKTQEILLKLMRLRSFYESENNVKK